MAAGRSGPVAVAVSGGSDSLALLLIADEWARGAARELLVLTVDHGLRPEAAEEAASVVDRAAALGHAAKFLTWTGEKPTQQHARRARHTLLAVAAREAGAELLLLGHTRTDVEETMLMRLARPTTLSSAVGPQPVSVAPVWPEGRGLLLGRPLIAVPRMMIMAWLFAAGERWVLDPSNEADKYERIRIRKLAERLHPERLRRITADAMRLRALEDAQVAELLNTRLRTDGDGLISMDVEGMNAPALVARRLLSLLLQVAAGGDHSADASSIDALASELKSGGPASRITLGGAWLQRRGDHLLIGRDPGEVTPGWSNGVWDGRYETGATSVEGQDVPFLVRHAVPDAPWHEILTERLSDWSEALRLGAELGADTADYSPKIPVSASTTRPG